MFQHQTDREYRIMMGTDTRIPRDPLAMRMKEDQIKQSTHILLRLRSSFLHYIFTLVHRIIMDFLCFLLPKRKVYLALFNPPYSAYTIYIQQ